MLVEFMQNRRPSIDEMRLINYLVKKSAIQLSENWANLLMVRSMDDGNMGSLFLCDDNNFQKTNRKFSKQISDCSFIDSDGIMVVASLYVDQHDQLFELDIWKTDYSPLIEIPLIFE